MVLYGHEDAPIPRTRLHLHRAGRIRDRVVDQVVEDLVQVARLPETAPTRSAHRQRGPQSTGAVPPPLDGTARRVTNVDLGGSAFLDPPGHEEQAFHDPGQAIDLLVRRLQLSAQGVGGSLVDGGLQSELHAGEGRSELVGCVGHELALGSNGLCEPVGHIVEGPAELSDLFRTAGGFRSGGEVAGAQPLGGPGQPAKRSGEGLGKHEGDDQPGEQAGEADDDQTHDGATDLRLDPGHALRESHHTVEQSFVQDGRRGDQDVLSQIHAVSGGRVRLLLGQDP
jgi:hypothetical protein